MAVADDVVRVINNAKLAPQPSGKVVSAWISYCFRPISHSVFLGSFQACCSMQEAS